MRRSYDIYSDHASVYPGEYDLLPGQREEFFRQAGTAAKEEAYHPPTSISDFTDHYRIEISAPGLFREDFFITTQGRRLVIRATSPVPDKMATGGHNRLPANQAFEETLVLPAGVDTDFAYAAYGNGILTVCLYKVGKSGESRANQIIVY